MCATLVGTDNKAECSDSFGHKWWVLACLHASSSLDVVKVPLPLPLVQPYGSTTDNHKILLQFNLHKLYNL